MTRPRIHLSGWLEILESSEQKLLAALTTVGFDNIEEYLRSLFEERQYEEDWELESGYQVRDDRRRLDFDLNYECGLVRGLLNEDLYPLVEHGVGRVELDYWDDDWGLVQKRLELT